MSIKVSIHGKNGNSQVFLGEVINQLSELLPDKRVILITDKNVHDIYGSLFADFSPIVLAPGEEAKSLRSLEFVASQLIDLQADRDSFLLGVGGGVVCDLTGFMASIYMRGCEFGYLATSLLAMVDASVGGKTGINFGGRKNMLGTFAQPSFVLCDPIFLDTLPPQEMKNGLAEAFKHTLLQDWSLWPHWTEHIQTMKQGDAEALTPILEQSIRFKAQVVNLDEQEKGWRKILNLGHTLGHAFESALGIPHGEAIAAGMMLDLDLSVRHLQFPPELAIEIKNWMKSVGYHDLRGQMALPLLEKYIRNDKKKSDDRLAYPLLKNPGEPELVSWTFAELIHHLQALWEHE